MQTPDPDPHKILGPLSRVIGAELIVPLRNVQCEEEEEHKHGEGGAPGPRQGLEHAYPHLPGKLYVLYILSIRHKRKTEMTQPLAM